MSEKSHGSQVIEKVQTPLETNSKTQTSQKADPKDTKLYGERAIEESQLQRFENRSQYRNYEIDFTCPEFTCLCPRSGFPDFATIYIKYIPDQWCIELKSLKLYINKYRNQRIFHEDVTNQILNDLIQLLDPKTITVKADFNVRGNIHTVITASHNKQKPLSQTFENSNDTET